MFCLSGMKIAAFLRDAGASLLRRAAGIIIRPNTAGVHTVGS